MDCTVVWKIGSLDIASSSQEGIVTASTIGATTLTAKAVSRDGQVGEIFLTIVNHFILLRSLAKTQWKSMFDL